MKELIRLMEKDNIDLFEYHKGFLCEGDYPFTTPLIKGTVVIWMPSDIHPCTKIGENVMIGRYTNICGPIKIGNNVRIQGFCFIPDGVEIGNYVFIGPNVTFTNMKRPKVRHNRMRVRDGLTVIEDDVAIGAGAIIGPGVRIGKGSLIGMGAVVTKDVPKDSVFVGCPARKL